MLRIAKRSCTVNGLICGWRDRRNIQKIGKLYTESFGTKTLEDFESFDEKHDAFKLLMEIQAVTCKFETQQYVHASLYESKRRMYLVNQSKDISNQRYLEEFKSIHQVLEHYNAHIGYDMILVEDEFCRAGVTMD